MREEVAQPTFALYIVFQASQIQVQFTPQGLLPEQPNTPPRHSYGGASETLSDMHGEVLHGLGSLGGGTQS